MAPGRGNGSPFRSIAGEKLDRLCREAIAEFGMGVNGRLAEKFEKVRGISTRVTARVEQRLDALIAREDAFPQREDKAFAPHEAVIQGVEQELVDLENMLRRLSNDPLPESGNGSGG